MSDGRSLMAEFPTDGEPCLLVDIALFHGQ
jgi:hypothetical protein